MLLSVFSPIYEALCGANPEYSSEYRDQIFGSVGTFTTVFTLIMLILFYVVLGRWKMIWYNLLHWAITLTLTAIGGFFIAYLTARNLLELVDGYVWKFAFANGIYAALFFILLSFLFKNLSVFSKRTPF